MDRSGVLLPVILAAIAAGAGDANLALANDEQTPPTRRDYYCEAVDAETGQPVAGVTVEARERIDQYYCARFENEVCTDCNRTERTQSRLATTDAQGKIHVIFSLPYCEAISDDPPLWEKRIHDSWEDPLIDDGGAEVDSWIVGRVEWVGEEELDHRIHLVRESQVIERFAPVLHRHRGRELQSDVADLVRSVDDHASLDAFDVGGRRVLHEDPPPLHVFDGHYMDTYGSGTQQPYLVLDFDDGVLHDGAPPGERPLYAHVFPYEDGLVVQYWIWLQGNDLRGLPGAVGFHEGDWERLSLYVELEGSEWVPKQVNLSQHRGGQSLSPLHCWWSETSEPTYAGLSQGYAAERTHPHVWIAANSHAVYNRFDPVYRFDLEIPLLCDVAYADRVDYNRADVPAGDHGFFEYDRIENSGEFTRVSEAHGESYFWHWSGGPLEYLMFVGRFGEPHCTNVPDCADFCGISGLGYTYRAPLSPLMESATHHWDSFVMDSGRFGNAPESVESISWGDAYLLGDYLGRLATCEAGWGDVLQLPLPALYGEVPAVARFTPVSGNVEVHEADPYGEIPLGLPVQGEYLLELSRIGGEGEGRFDVTTELGYPLAVDLRFDVVPSECQDPADIPGGRNDADGGGNAPDGGDPDGEAPGAGAAGASGAKDSVVRILGNPSRYGFHADLGSTRHAWVSWTLHDLGGRRIAGGSVEEGIREIAWRSPESGRLVPGRYFLRLAGRDGATTAATVVVVR